MESGFTFKCKEGKLLSKDNGLEKETKLQKQLVYLVKRIPRLNPYGRAENNLREHIGGHSSKLWGEQLTRVILTDLWGWFSYLEFFSDLQIKTAETKA